MIYPGVYLGIGILKLVVELGRSPHARTGMLLPVSLQGMLLTVLCWPLIVISNKQF